MAEIRCMQCCFSKLSLPRSPRRVREQPFKGGKRVAVDNEGGMAAVPVSTRHSMVCTQNQVAQPQSNHSHIPAFMFIPPLAAPPV